MRGLEFDLSGIGGFRFPSLVVGRSEDGLKGLDSTAAAIKSVAEKTSKLRLVFQLWPER